MKHNKGETLPESLLAIFFIVLVLSPVASLLLSAFRNNTKIDRKNHLHLENENMAEILKAKGYNFLISFIGEHRIKNIDNFYSLFGIEGKYRVLYNREKLTEKDRKIEIKRTEDFYLNERGEREYILEIKVDNFRSYCFPSIE